jgi:hypothetical protein
MQIVDYASLQTAAADWMNRADLTSRLPDFVGLAELRMMRELRIRLLENETAVNPASGARTVSLPPDYREPLNLWFNNGVDREPLRYVPAPLLDVWVAPGRPYSWTIDGTNIAFERPTDSTYGFTFRYRQKLALSDASPTNVLLTQYPDAYLFATCAEIARYLKDPDAATAWDAQYGAVAHKIREVEQRQDALVTLSTEPAQLNQRRVGYNIYRGW